MDLGAAIAAASLPEAPLAEARLRRALLNGATAFERLEAEAVLEAGQLRFATGRLAAEGGVAATLSGGADLARGALDLRIGTRPLPEISDWARWRAGRS